MKTKGMTGPPDGVTEPLPQKVITSRLGNFNFILRAVPGIGSNAPDGLAYVAGADSVSENTCTTSAALAVDTVIYSVPESPRSRQQISRRTCDKEGKPDSVRYDAVNAMLLNEFLKKHRTVQELKSTVAKQEATILQQKKDFQATAAHQQKQIEKLTEGLEKVSAQLEASKPAAQIVNNP
jgi:hypothetical protein